MPVRSNIDFGGGVDDGRGGAGADVVAVERDVERAGEHGRADELGDLGREARRQRDAAAVDPDDHDRSVASIAFGDLMGDAG